MSGSRFQEMKEECKESKLENNFEKGKIWCNKSLSDSVYRSSIIIYLHLLLLRKVEFEMSLRIPIKVCRLR